MSFFKQSLFVLAMTPIVLSAQPAWLNDGLVAYYSFEGETVDLSGNQHHLNFLNPAPNLEEAFDSSIDQSKALIISPDFALKADIFSEKLGNKNRTVAAWVKYEDGDGVAWAIGRDARNQLMGLRTNPREWMSWPGYNDDSLGEINRRWQYHVQTYIDGRLWHFIDGRSVLAKEISLDTGESVFSLGMAPYGGVDDLTANIDELRVWDRGLTKFQVRDMADYEMGRVGLKKTADWINSKLEGIYNLDGSLSDAASKMGDIDSSGPSFVVNGYDSEQKALVVTHDNETRVPLPLNGFGRLNAYTISFWVKVNDYYKGNNTIIKFGSSCYNENVGELVYDDISGVLKYVDGCVDGYNQTINLGGVNLTEEWTHVVIARGATNAGILSRVFLNGEEAGISDNFDIRETGGSGLTNKFMILGGKVVGQWDSFIGDIDAYFDNIRFYNKDLSSFEAAQLYELERPVNLMGDTRIARASAQVVNGFVVRAEITDGGYGYTSNPEVTITGEGGFGAIATATVSEGQVIKINIQNPGAGYTGNPTIDIAAPPVPPASAYATGEVVNGFLVGATLVTGGEAYNEAPKVTVTGGGGSGAVAVAQVEDGRVVAVNIINPGNGYTSTPVITIAAPASAPELSIRVTQVEVNMKLTVGKRYTIEASKNMVDWVQAGDLFTAEEQFKAVKFDVDDFGQFYRVIEQP